MIYLGLGANVPGKYGPPEKAIQAALDEIGADPEIEVVAASSIWHSAPVPLSNQPWFANAVCAVKTYLPPGALLARLKKIEQNAGREERERNAPRVLDLDIIAYGKFIAMDAPILPHPRMHERAFVLYPLQEITPDWLHPALEIPLSELIETLPQDQQIRRGEKLLIQTLL